MVPSSKYLAGLRFVAVSGTAFAQITNEVVAVPAAQAQFYGAQQPCSVPVHWCVEGTLLESGGQCTTYCPAGLTPDVQQLHCDNGVLDPNLFECLKGQKKSMVSLICAFVALSVCTIWIIGMLCANLPEPKARQSAVDDVEVEELEPLESPTNQPLLAPSTDQE
mmetsp:Transcript_50039/g.116775  ORF Transcript_50039/g.116775 Transcript_50039/m.116775 type:complete len:164 (+) Transcript_50039:75-566(+)